MVKRLSTMWETRVQTLGWEDPLEEGKATHSSIPALLSITPNFQGRRKWQPTPVFLPGKSHGQRSLVGYSPWGRKESDTTERLHFLFTFNKYMVRKETRMKD